MDLKNEMLIAYQNAYRDNPGLESFHRWKKRLLWGMFGIAALQKIVIISLMSGQPLLPMIIGAVIGLGIPGIFALAVYQGPWNFALVLYFLVAQLLFDLISNGIPALTSGIEYLPIFYVILGIEVFYTVYLLAITLWMTVPARNRAYAQLLNDIYKEYSRKMKSMSGTYHR